MAPDQNLICVAVAHLRESFLRWVNDPVCILERSQADPIFIVSPSITREDPVLIQEENLNVENQIAVKKMVSPVVGNVSPVAIRRNPVNRVNAKKEKNPVPIKKRTAQRIGLFFGQFSFLSGQGFSPFLHSPDLQDSFLSQPDLHFPQQDLPSFLPQSDFPHSGFPLESGLGPLL